jgi:ABC-type transporter Mla maintaining outer membrane lipid asymmetry permease subunit MlaE
MYGVMAAVKGNQALTGMATAAFTIAPFLLILARVRGWWYGVIYLVVGVEVFCNCAGFYGGLTGLQHSLYVEPTTFLHMVTTMTDSANEPTALLLSVFFSVAIAALAIAPVENLKKFGG